MKLQVAQQTAPVVLNVVAPEHVKVPLDRFKCGPYNATLTAKSCVERQKIAGVQEKQLSKENSFMRRGSDWQRTGKTCDYFHCRACPVGEGIRKALAS